jgi:hypothetical protein
MTRFNFWAITLRKFHKMMFELIAAAVVAAFVSCLYPMVRGFFRDLGEIGSRRPGSRHSDSATLGQQEPRRQKAQRRPSGI